MNQIQAIERFPAEMPRVTTAAPAAAVTTAASTAAPATPPSSGAQSSRAPTPSSSPADMRFELDQDSQQVVVRISDPDTGEIVRQIPSEVLLRVAQMISDARGGTVDARV